MPTKKELYNLTKEMLHAKFNGLCAFCGYELGERWCIWDIEPRNTIVTTGGDVIFGNDSYENKLPACISCNSTRTNSSWDKNSKIDIEKFRMILYREFEFLRDGAMNSTYYKKSIRYGLIKETGNKIVFHFEKIKNEP